MAKRPPDPAADFLAEHAFREAVYQQLVETRRDALAIEAAAWPECLSSAIAGLGRTVYIEGPPCGHTGCEAEVERVGHLVALQVGEAYAWVGFDLLKRLLNHSELTFPLNGKWQAMPAQAEVTSEEPVDGFRTRVTIEVDGPWSTEAIVTAAREWGRARGRRSSGRLGELSRPQRLIYWCLRRRSEGLGSARLTADWESATRGWASRTSEPLPNDDARLAFLEWRSLSGVAESIDDSDVRAELRRGDRFRQFAPSRWRDASRASA